MHKGNTSSCNVLALTPAYEANAQHHTTPAEFLSIDVLRTKLITKHPVLKTALNTIICLHVVFINKKEQQLRTG